MKNPSTNQSSSPVNHLSVAPHRPKPMKTRPPISRHHRPKSPIGLLSPPTETDEKPSTNQSSSPTQITLSVAVSPTETDEKTGRPPISLSSPTQITIKSPYRLLSPPTETDENQSTNQSSSPSPYRLLSPPTETDANQSSLHPIPTDRNRSIHQSVVITDQNHPIGCCPHRPKPMKTCPPISRHHRPKSPYRLLSPPTETDEKPRPPISRHHRPKSPLSVAVSTDRNYHTSFISPSF